MPIEAPAVITVTRVDDTTWELLVPVIYRGQTDVWTVPEGFHTDFASVPGAAAWLVPRTGAYTAAAIVHDWLCSVAVPDGRVSPADADGVFRRIMREEGVPPVQRWLMWAGVRWSAAWSPPRRAGWWATAPQMVAVTVVAVPALVPAGVGVAVGLVLYRAAEAIVRGVGAARDGEAIVWAVGVASRAGR